MINLSKGNVGMSAEDLADVLIYTITEAIDNGDEYSVIRGKFIKTLIEKLDMTEAPTPNEGLINVLKMIKRELLGVSFYYKEDMKRAIQDCLLLASVALDQIYNRKK